MSKAIELILDSLQDIDNKSDSLIEVLGHILDRLETFERTIAELSDEIRDVHKEIDRMANELDRIANNEEMTVAPIIDRLDEMERERDRVDLLSSVREDKILNMRKRRAK